jgi:hypothetical protein
LKAPQLPGPARTCAVCCDLAAYATVRVAAESLAEWRRQPGPVPGGPLPLSFLKHADEQTVVGLAAVLRAVHEHGLAADFRDWGVLAAPRFLGRPVMAVALQRFQAEGAWGVSPHLIPHRSLHSISGTVSQALKIHGPNFGVGGGPGCAAEALLAAAAMLERQRLPGVWAVLTCLDPEQPPSDLGRPAAGTFCVGLALALVPGRAAHAGIRLRVLGGVPPADAPPRPERPAGFDLLRLDRLLGMLRGDRRGETTLVQLLDPCGRIELSRAASPAAECSPPAARALGPDEVISYQSSVISHQSSVTPRLMTEG